MNNRHDLYSTTTSRKMGQTGAACIAPWTLIQGVPDPSFDCVAGRCGTEQVTFRQLKKVSVESSTLTHYGTFGDLFVLPW